VKKGAIAIIIPGGIGTGHNNIGVPVMERIVKLLSLDFQITVFSLFKINPDYRQDAFELVSIHGSSSLIKVLKFVGLFFRHHRKKNFTIIHGFWTLPGGFLAVAIGKLFKIKSIVSVLGGDAISLPEINYGQLQKKSSRRLILWTLRNADEVICLTEYLVNNLKRFGLVRDIKIIPWGIDTDAFKFKEEAVHQPVRFLHIANLSPVKDQSTLIKSFKIIHDKVSSGLTIIGEGILEPEVKLLVKSLKLEEHVKFLGLLPYEDLPVHYQQADILLHTSLSEGQSEVVTEAMSCGVVVCGTKVGLIYDQPSCCISVEVKDFEALGQRVLQLLKDPRHFELLKRNARDWASTHSIHWTAEKIKELYFSANA
jgi:glycosyltransferase involved in cell wall biosynthesis